MVYNQTTKPVGADIELASASTRQHERTGIPPETYPYRRGLSCLLRGFFGTLSTGILALNVFLLDSNTLGDNISKSTFAAPLATCGLSILLNYFALISSILRRYGPRGHWKLMIFVEPIVTCFGIWAYVVFAYNLQDQVVPDEGVGEDGKKWIEYYKPILRGLVADMSLAIGLLHLAAALGGLWGMKLVSMRRKAYDTTGSQSITGLKMIGWANPSRSGRVAHTGYPEPN
ncbi:hypothetical protein B0T16DRAFT_460738 [Cercophora newfieldiana]|uniref:Uncharacterized protein n=1 Tax=Cercophora newfieldiana TaxID=92897 RepID=A0AA40CKN2_9PEZI|nr:hypothetical protein B0T16DRAFT_460738 [Cercophora newfieldiana]